MKISRKGVELPTSTLVVLAVAIIVLLSVVAWFVGAFGGTSFTFQRGQDFRNCCQAYVNSGCQDDPATFAPGTCGTKADGTRATLADRASEAGVAVSRINSACGCPSTSGTGTSGTTGGGGTTDEDFGETPGA